MLAGYAWGQTAPVYSEIARIRQNVRTYLDHLPRITCTETTRQSVRFTGSESTETREDSCDTHVYKLLSLQSAGIRGGRTHERLNDASLETSTGFLAALVDPTTDAGVHWLSKWNGRTVAVYTFHAATPQGFLLADSNGSFRVPFKGLIYADAVTAALVRVEMQCMDIPRQSEYIDADVTVEFSSFNVEGRAIDLPAHSRVHFRMRQGEAINEADYSAYRLSEFGANTRITFADEVVE